MVMVRFIGFEITEREYMLFGSIVVYCHSFRARLTSQDKIAREINSLAGPYGRKKSRIFQATSCFQRPGRGLKITLGAERNGSAFHRESQTQRGMATRSLIIFSHTTQDAPINCGRQIWPAELVMPGSLMKTTMASYLGEPASDLLYPKPGAPI